MGVNMAKMIVTLKEWVHETFDDKINQYLSDGYEILSISCGLEGNEDGMDAVFVAILSSPGEE
jgi:hypothetical protein